MDDEESEAQWQRDFAVLSRDPAFWKSYQEFEKIAARRDLGNWTLDEAAVVYHYSMDLDRIEVFNRRLREGNPNEQDSALRRLLDKALSKAPAYEGGLYRRIEVGDFGAFLNRYRVGAVVTEDAFTSTTYSKEALKERQGNVAFIYQGRTGRKIEAVAGDQGEHEVLFKAGARFEVLEVNVLRQNIEISLEEV